MTQAPVKKTVDTAALVEPVCELARAAGAAIMPHFRSASLVTNRKKDASPVTAADTAAEAVILAGLRQLTPDIPIVAEESVAAGDIPEVGEGPFWLVDPLDGTKEFVAGRPEFTVNIALVVDRRPVLGVVYSPASDDLYAGRVPGGAFMELSGQPRRAISTRRMDPDGISIVLSRTYGSSVELDRFLEHYRVREQLSAGSSIKFCLIARGDADVYPRYGGTCEWDTAAAQAVLEAAGGSVRQINDGPVLTYGKPRFSNPYFIAWGSP